jgi:hypothetical protein
MKKNVLTSVVVFIFLSLAFALKAQTTLTIGDIAFTGYNSDGPDNFSFIILRPGGIESGTIINFTDYGWNTGDCGTNGWRTTPAETEVSWTAPSALSYGQQVAITGLTATLGTVTGTAFTFTAAGDQIFAFQGSRTGSHTLIAGIHMNVESGLTTAVNWDNLTPATPGVQYSNRPDCLTNGTYALYITNPADNNFEVDNARLSPTVVLTGDKGTDLALVNNASNWELNDITVFTLPTVFTTPLPIHFNAVKAFERNRNIQIDWKMDLQDNVVKYIVERSSDGETFTDLSTIPVTASGSYSFTDQQPSGQVSYYRIKAIELTGNVRYTRVMRINLTGASSGMKIYPTVVTNHEFNLQMNNLPQGSYTLHVYNTAGQVIINKVLPHAGGTSTQTLLLPANVSKGMYKIRLGDKGKVYYSSVVVE